MALPIAASANGPGPEDTEIAAPTWAKIRRGQDVDAVHLLNALLNAGGISGKGYWGTLCGTRRSVGPDRQLRVSIRIRWPNEAFEHGLLRAHRGPGVPGPHLVQRRVDPHRRRASGVHGLDEEGSTEVRRVPWPTDRELGRVATAVDDPRGEPLLLDVIELIEVAPVATGWHEPARFGGTQWQGELCRIDGHGSSSTDPGMDSCIRSSRFATVSRRLK